MSCTPHSILHKLHSESIEDIQKTGIYILSVDYIADKVYVGSASSNGKRKPADNGFWHRWSTHLAEFRNNTHHNSYLQNIVNAHGFECLRFIIIEFCDPFSCPEREEFYIKKYDSYKNGFNLSEYTKNSFLNKKHTQKTRAILSEKAMGRTAWNKGLPKHLQPWYGRHIADSSKEKSAITKRKKVYQYSLDGRFIKEWNSLKEVASFYNMTTSGVSRAIRRKYKLFASDSVLSFIKSNNIAPYGNPRSTKKMKPINIYDNESNKVIHFESRNALANHLKISTVTLLSRIKQGKITIA